MKKIITALLLIMSFGARAQTRGEVLQMIKDSSAVQNNLVSVTNFTGSYIAPPAGTLQHYVYQGTSNGALTFDFYNTGNPFGAVTRYRRIGGTPTAPTAVTNSTSLGGFTAFGYGTSQFNSLSDGAYIIRSEEDFTNTAHGTYHSFQTTAAGTTTLSEKMRLRSNGTLSLATLTTAGFMQNAANGDLFSTDAATTRTNLGLGSVATLNAIPYASLTNIPSTFTPSTHTHGDADITALAYGKLTGAPTIPNNTNQLTNGAGFITGITSGNVTTALGFTPYNATNPNGYISSVPAQTFASLTGKPTTLAGYGITDNILLTNGSAAALTNFPTFNQNTTGTASNITGNLPQSQVVNLVTDLAGKQASLVSGTNIKTVNGNSLLGSGDIALSTNTQVFIPLAANFSSSIVTEVAVTGWSFAVTAGKAYRIRVSANYQTAAITTGGELGFFLVGAGTINGKLEGAIVSTATATNLQQGIISIGVADAAGSNLITTGVTAINSPHYIGGEVIFTCTTSGTLSIGWATEVAASAAQLNAGSSLIYQQLN